MTTSLEKLANASMKNRAEYSQLSTELNRLEKEKKNELRMFNNEIQRFRARYSRTNFNNDSPEASNVKMYETHNPGFCFKRNGEHRVQQQVDKGKPSVDFEHLHFLLFTNGEVDIEKILCLHLLSSHETDHLTPPRRPRVSGSFMKKDSPLEQLIERSEGATASVLSTVLPTYVLDVRNDNPKRTNLDERLSARLLINEKLLELIMTVIAALEHSNPEKVQQLVHLAEDPSRLKRVFYKESIQNFVMTLKEHSIVSSCYSFILTQPSKRRANHIEIRTPSGALEDLIRYIRSTVLQFPKRESFTFEEEKELMTIEHNPVVMKKSFSDEQRISPPKKTSWSQLPASPKFKRKAVNHIQKNIDYVANKRASKEESSFGTNSRRRSSADSRKSRASTDSTRRTSVGRDSSFSTTKRDQCDGSKYHLKQTTCPACMEKWKVPLPDPKVPKISYKSLESSSFDKPLVSAFAAQLVKTDSERRLKNLIEQEQFKLNTYDRKYSNASTASVHKKKKSITSDSLDLVALNVLDLERIRYEIREKETKKKLEKFLSTA